mmetsp:Transcript_53179/g.91340  ORF Transcript_53179/g.91340 Transcript_53179/m.91340 type:complete len:345 (-) Transcript_53179:252-1286(-)
MVAHCHILVHEDQGMMGYFDVGGTEGAVFTAAQSSDSTCYYLANSGDSTLTRSRGGTYSSGSNSGLSWSTAPNPTPVPTAQPSPAPSTGFAPTPGPPAPSPTKSPTQDGGGSGGHCFPGTERLLVQNAVTRDVVSTALVDVKVGDKVLTVDHHQKKQFATVKELPHSPSVGDFIEIHLAPSTTEGEAPTEETPKKSEMSVMSSPFLGLRTTEHHTFPQCKSAKPHLSHHLRKHQSTEAMIQAHEIKEGDCLLTLDGERTVKSVKRRLATSEDVTYTVQLEGAHDLLVVGGVVTHAKPSPHAAPHETPTAFGLFEKANKKVHSAEKKVSALSNNKDHIRKKTHGT